MNQIKNELSEWRKHIDSLDEQLLYILASRIDKVRKIGIYKNQHNLKIISQKRKSLVLKKWQLQAKELNLPDAFIEDIYTVIHDYSVKVEKNE